jgi:hypothetical protein
MLEFDWISDGAAACGSDAVALASREPGDASGRVPVLAILRALRAVREAAEAIDA